MRSWASPACRATDSGSSPRRLRASVPLEGSIRLDGVELAGTSPLTHAAAGLGYVPEERMRDGVVAEFSVAQNLLLVEKPNRVLAASGSLDARHPRVTARSFDPEFDVRTPARHARHETFLAATYKS